MNRRQSRRTTKKSKNKKNKMEDAATVRTAIRLLRHDDGLSLDRVAEIACEVSQEKTRARLIELLTRADNWERVIYMLRFSR